MAAVNGTMAGTGADDRERAARAYFAASEAADGDAVGALVTDEVTWWVPQSAAARNGIPRPVVGRQALIDTFWRGARYRHGTRRWTIDRVLVAGDMVAVQASMQAVLTEGADYDNDYVYLFRFEGPAIAEVWEHLDTAYFFDRRDSATGGQG
jgi:ketosteroid isomerase-like protein